MCVKHGVTGGEVTIITGKPQSGCLPALADTHAHTRRVHGPVPAMLSYTLEQGLISAAALSSEGRQLC